MISPDFFLPVPEALRLTTKLLAVDDSKTLRKVLEITFAGEDFQTELAASADEALQKLRASRPVVAVVDTALGGESGYDLCQQIKSEAPDVAVVLLSSKHRPYDQGRGAQVGADDYIDKPFDTQKLIDKVNGLLAQGRPRAAAAAPAPAPRTAPAPSAAPVRPAPGPAAPVAAAAAPAARPAVSAAPQTPAVSAAPRPAGPAPAAQAPAAQAPAMSARPVAPTPQFSGAARPAAAGPTAGAAPGVSAAPPRVAAAVAAAGAELDGQLRDLGLNADQIAGVLALSREVVEKVVWEVVPVLAETLIKEEIARLTAE
jgi:CheY-like chemotaxis protein